MIYTMLSFYNMQGYAVKCLTTIYEKGPQNMEVGTENEEQTNMMLKFQIWV